MLDVAPDLTQRERVHARHPLVPVRGTTRDLALEGQLMEDGGLPATRCGRAPGPSK